jgi:hypothetical protein
MANGRLRILGALPGREWRTASPPPTVNVVDIAMVAEGPYAYPPSETVHSRNV